MGAHLGTEMRVTQIVFILSLWHARSLALSISTTLSLHIFFRVEKNEYYLYFCGWHLVCEGFESRNYADGRVAKWVLLRSIFNPLSHSPSLSRHLFLAHALSPFFWRVKNKTAKTLSFSTPLSFMHALSRSLSRARSLSIILSINTSNMIGSTPTVLVVFLANKSRSLTFNIWFHGVTHGLLLAYLWFICVCYMPHSYVWHDIFASHHAFIRVTGRIHMCDITHSCVVSDLFIALIHVFVSHDSCTCVTCRIHMFDMTHSCMSY